MSANQQIRLDTDGLTADARALGAVGEDLNSVAATAGGVSIGSSAFGTLNSYLAGPVNLLARRSSELIGAAGELASAMETGVTTTVKDLTAVEESVAAQVARINEIIASVTKP